jgi:hypothetical protein
VDISYAFTNSDIDARPGQDYFETFASTMRHATVHIVLALAAIEDMEL